jgi:hypothetical protein
LPAYFVVDNEVTDPALRLRTARGSVVLLDGVTPERR